MSYSVKIDSTELSESYDKLSTVAKKRVDLFIGKVARDLDKAVKKNYNKPGTGIIYVRGGISHQASRPGEAPAKDRGDLVNSVELHKTGNAEYELFSRMPRAFWLEHGTRTVKKRPNWVPEIEKARKSIKKIGEQVVKRAIKEAGLS